MMMEIIIIKEKWGDDLGQCDLVGVSFHTLKSGGLDPRSGSLSLSLSLSQKSIKKNSNQ